MSWSDVIQVAADVAAAALRDLKDEQERVARDERREMNATVREEARRAHFQREEQLRRHLTELRAQEDLLRTAPVGVPGVEAALKEIHQAQRRLKALGTRNRGRVSEFGVSERSEGPTGE